MFLLTNVNNKINYSLQQLSITAIETKHAAYRVKERDSKHLQQHYKCPSTKTAQRLFVKSRRYLAAMNIVTFAAGGVVNAVNT